MVDSRRLLSLIAVLSLFLLLITVQGAQAQPGAAIQPPVVEEPVDLDRNGLYDELRLLVTLDVLIAGDYQLVAQLDTPSRRPTAPGAVVTHHFTQGVQEHVLSVPGDILHGLGDGPYQIELYIQGPLPNYLVIDRIRTETMPYLAIDFEPPFMSFRAPFMDRVTDPDGNGLWDQLVIDVGLEVRRRLAVRVSGLVELGHDTWPYYLRSWPTELQFLEPGETAVEIAFLGQGFHAFARDGPYNVTVSVYTEGVPFRRYIIPHQTAVYRVAEAERTSAEFADRPPESRLVDDNGNGQADLLLLEIPLEVRRAGDFLVRGDFIEPCRPRCPWLSVSQRVHLEPGNRTVTLQVGGVNLGRSPTDGPWGVQLVVMNLAGGTLDSRSLKWTTPAYSRPDFEAPPPLVLNGTLRSTDGRPVWARITVLDPERMFRTTVQASSSGYALALYEGRFTLLIRGELVEDWEFDVRGEFVVDLKNDTERDFALNPSSPETEVFEISIEGNAATVVATRTSYAPAIRAEADFNGDFDGTANETELALLAPRSTGILEMEFDGVPLRGNRVEYEVMTGAGTYTEPGPLVVADMTSFRGPGLGPAAVPGKVTIRTIYDCVSLDRTFRVGLPPNFDVATLTNPPNVSVRQLDTGQWEFDPGRQPPGLPPAAGLVVVVEFRLSLGLDPVQRGLLVLAGVIPVGALAYIWGLRIRKRASIGR